MATKKLYRSAKDRVIAGVAGGIADYFAIDPILIRLAFVLLTLANGTGFLAYIIAWIVIPEEPTVRVDDSATESKSEAKKDTAKDIEDKVKEAASTIKESAQRARQNQNPTIPGVILLIVGVLFLLQNLTRFDVWGNFWPILLIGLGLSIIFRNMATKED